MLGLKVIGENQHNPKNTLNLLPSVSIGLLHLLKKIHEPGLILDEHKKDVLQ